MPATDQSSEVLRFGSVPYLNARPLIYGLSGEIEFQVPAKLTRDFRAGRYDAALIPTYEALALSEARFVDGVAIACRGPVYSVFLAYHGPLRELREVALDPASRTSVHLLKVFMLEFLGMDPVFLNSPKDGVGARLVIGDPAIEFRRSAAGEWNILDLGDAWEQRTGLPFVFACWVLGERAPVALAARLRAAKAAGVDAIDEIVHDEADPEFARTYLREFIRFDLAEREKEAIALFEKLLVKHGFLPDQPVPGREFV